MSLLLMTIYSFNHSGSHNSKKIYLSESMYIGHSAEHNLKLELTTIPAIFTHITISNGFLINLLDGKTVKNVQIDPKTTVKGRKAHI